MDQTKHIFCHQKYNHSHFIKLVIRIHTSASPFASTSLFAWFSFEQLRVLFGQRLVSNNPFVSFQIYNEIFCDLSDKNLMSCPQRSLTLMLAKLRVTMTNSSRNFLCFWLWQWAYRSSDRSNCLLILQNTTPISS